MIKKIVSGGQTGVDQAALDASRAWDIPHGGWIPKGRLTEDGPLPDGYNLKEMPTDSYPERTQQNVIDSDGTVIISHGDLTGGSLYTQHLAYKHKKPCLHVDLDRIDSIRAAKTILDWINENRIEVLNVAGPRASKDPKIYEAAESLIEAVISLDSTQSDQAGLDTFDPPPPQTVDDAVTRLILELPLRDRNKIANMDELDLVSLHPTLGNYIRNKYRLWSDNEALLDSCRFRYNTKITHPDTASGLIINELWKKLRETHSLRVVK
ncbi:YpsA SLOG family protein [Thermodesulfobacteriota bacterium]